MISRRNLQPNLLEVAAFPGRSRRIYCPHRHASYPEAINCALDKITYLTGRDETWRKYPL